MRTHRIAPTSVKAYYEMIAGPQLGDQQRRIVEFLAKHAHRDHTRAEIAKGTGILLQSVCGRVFELLDQKLIHELATRKCFETGRSARPLSLLPVQQEMFAA